MVFGDKTTTIQNAVGITFYHYDGKKLYEFTRPEDVSDDSKKFIFKQKINSYKYTLTDQGIVKDSKIYNTICVSADVAADRAYWVSEIANTYTSIMLRRVRGASIESGTLLTVTGSYTSQTNTSIRPVVELRPDIELIGSSAEGWTIVQN